MQYYLLVFIYHCHFDNLLGFSDMYIISVHFKIHEEHLAEFMPAMRLQAQNSLNLEPECSGFDVCVSENDDTEVFLYETYSSKEAFHYHLTTEHFLRFNTLITPWVVSRELKGWHKQGH